MLRRLWVLWIAWGFVAVSVAAPFGMFRRRFANRGPVLGLVLDEPIENYYGMTIEQGWEAIRADVYRLRGVPLGSRGVEARRADRVARRRFDDVIGRFQARINTPISRIRLRGYPQDDQINDPIVRVKLKGYPQNDRINDPIVHVKYEAYPPPTAEELRPRPLHRRAAILANQEGPPRERYEVEIRKIARRTTGVLPPLKLSSQDQKQLEKIVRAKVMQEQGVTRFSPPGAKAQAESTVPARVQRALRDGTALDLLGR